MTDRARRLAKLSPAKRALLERQLAARRRERAGARGVTIRARDTDRDSNNKDAPPLSFSQERFWFLQQLEPQSAEYNVVAAGRFAGALNREALRRALANVVQRHEILRTTFPVVDGLPTLDVARDVHVPLPCVDLSRRGAEREALALAEAKRFGAQAIDLSQGPLLRAELIQLADDEHVMLILQHHIVTDGWSLAVLIRELSADYSAQVRRDGATLPTPTLQFPDYAAWEREHLAGERLERELDFWREQLAGAPAALELPFDRARPALQTHAGRTVRYGFGSALSHKLRKLANAQGSTLFITLFAAFDALLARLCGQHDVVVGTSIANRDRPEVAGLLGPLMNTLALRVDCSGEPSFVDLLARVRAVSAAAFAHPDVPFERVVAELVAERDPSHSPVFNVFFDMAVPIPPPSYEGLDVAAYPIDHERAMFDLALSLVDEPQEVSADVEFNTDLFERATIDRLWRSFEVLLTGIVAEPERPLHELPLLDEDERERVLHDFNATSLPLDAGAFLHRCFEEHAAATPDAPALEHDGQAMSYAELDLRANRLAQHLARRGVGPEVRVAVRLPRSADVLITLLAIWKAGGAYVPIDPADPPARQALLLAESKAAFLITRSDVGGSDALGETSGSSCRATSRATASSPTSTSLPVLELDTARDELAAESPAPLARDTSPDELAYVIFTSGSTGRPKGVAVTQGALLNHVAWVRDAFDITPADRFLLRTPLTFDASLWELVHPLASGACLVVAPSGVQRDPAALLELVAAARITVLQTVPSMLVSWLDEARFADCTRLRHLICAGETLRLDLVHAFDRRCLAAGMPTRMHNLYGPSEACIDASAHTCERGPDGLTRNGGRDTAPIGRPISNAVIHVLDAWRQPVPVGVAGELYVGGAGLARGYLDQAELSAERFVPNPFGAGRLYRTGDLGRYLPSGELEYLGRRDHQVKVRGHRIELGEVEVALAAHAQVKEAVVVTDGSQGNARLLAYVTALGNATLSAPQLRAFLTESLPQHMIPSRFLQLDALPLTASEKVDRAALPAAPSDSSASDSAHVAPRNATEARLAELTAELLELDRVSVHDDFFALGGHSLLATRLAARVRAEWTVDVPLLRFFETPTVAALAAAIDTSHPTHNDAAVAPRDRDASRELPLSFAQRRLWFLARLEPQATHFNMLGGLRLRGALDTAALDAAFVALVQRHEVLRTVFGEHEGTPHGLLQPTPSTLLQVEPLEAASTTQKHAALHAVLTREAAHVFDLAQGPLLRARLLRFGDHDHALVVNQHHIVSDAWSLGLMAQELEALYLAHSRGVDAELPDLTWQYADFAQWQSNALQGQRLDDLLDFWRDALAGAPAGVELPNDAPRPAQARHRGETLRRELPPALFQRATDLARASDATPFVVLLAAYQALLQRLTRQHDIVLLTAVANRTRLETESLLGFFINTLAVRVNTSGARSFRKLLSRSAQSAHAAFAHQDLPFERLVDEFGGRRDPSRPPISNLSFNLFSARGQQWRLGELDVQPLEITPQSSKLDLGITLIESEVGEPLSAELEYDTDLFERATIEQIWSLYELLLTACLRDPEQSFERVSLVSESDRARLLENARGPRLRHAVLPCVAELVAQHARATPSSEALVFGAQRWDYAALDARVDALAHRLRALSLPRDGLVGLCLPRGPESIVALLACWRARLAWVPVMPADPPARRRALLAEVGAHLLVTHHSFATEMAGAAPQVLLLDAPERNTPPVDSDTSQGPAAPAAHDPDALAYVLFTSGSTGRPKAVEMTHAALAHHTSWFVQHFDFEARDRVLHKIPLSFDAALLEVLPALAVGGTLVIADDDAALDPAELVALGRREGCSTLLAVPSLLAPIVEQAHFGEWHALRHAFSGGEALSAELVRRFAARRPAGSESREPAALHNLYGPTEACVNTTSFACPPEATAPIPIGRPVADVRTHVVDAHGELLPALLPGELWIGGPGLARGYRGAPDDTRAAFVSDPCDPTARAYRSGDLVRRRTDGQLVYLGRVDAQLKVRGQRVEPGEVETLLAEHATVRDVAVTCRDGSTLVAHVVGRSSAREELAAFAAQRLPSAMLPSRWRFVDELPRTAHGKLDRRTLEAAADEARGEIGRTGAGDTSPPRSPLEAQLTQLMSEVLGVEPLSLHDDFFERGGHSLLAIRLVARVNEALNIELPLRAVFSEPTPARLAVCVELLQGGGTLDTLEPTRCVNLRKEARLDDDIRPRAPTRAAPPREILLTGATGFLGAFLLRELLEQTDARLHCLVRARDADGARARLLANLERYELWPASRADEFAARLVPLAGDLGSAQLGLSDDHFAQLAASLDLIYHSGASVNFFHDYAKLEAPNVGGTRELLRLACRERATPFHFVSTIGVLAAPHAATLSELPEDIALDDFADLQGGYEQSKWVAEQLVHEAGRRGLPVAVYRPGRIVGHAHTGVGNLDDVGSRVLRGCLELGAAPAIDTPVDMTPVDFVAGAIAHISLHSATTSRAYHLVNPERVPLSQVFEWARDEGHALQSLEWQAWLDEVARHVAQHPASTLTPLLPLFTADGADESDFAPDVRLPPLAYRHVLQDLANSSLRCPPVNRAMLARWLNDFARRAPQDSTEHEALGDHR
ncbi:MAG: hypothetical protein DHS20C15_31340 [Planctomycetota bacterium]|nr:MAG: hypothetical protein DHS20C15_31340 [Planctomycetota bacterium]